MKRSNRSGFSRSRSLRASARRRASRVRFAPCAVELEERTLLSISIVDLSVLEGNSGPIEISGNFEASTETDHYQVQGKAGQTILFDSTTPAGTPGAWELYRPDGAYLTGSSITNDGLWSLPADGTYILAVSGPGYSSELASYSFRLFDVTVPDVPLSSNFQEVQSGTVASGETKYIAYTASAGTIVYFDNLDDYDGDSAYLRLLTPAGNQVYGTYSYSNDGRTPIVLPDSGTYQVQITGVGDYKFQLRTLADATTPLTLGATVEGNVPNFETRLFHFDGVVGQQLFFDSLLATNNNVQVTLIDPTGDVFGIDQNANSDRAVFTLAEPGRYVLAVQGRRTGDAGYKFRLTVPTSAAAPLTLGAEATASVDPLATNWHRFTAQAGQRIYFDPLSSTGNWYDVTWTVYGPNGQSVTSNYLYPDGQGDGEFVAATTGVYTVAITNLSGTAAAENRFRVVGTMDAAPISYTLGSTRTGSISTIGEQDAYTFTGTVGQKLYLDGRGGSSITARLYSPAGTEILNSPLTQDSSVFTLSQSGSYRLVIDGSGAATGNYTFRLSDVASATALTLGNERGGTLAAAAATDLYRFNATAGQRIYVDPISSTGNWNDIYWTVYGPNGQSVTSNYLYPDGQGDGEFVAATTGVYTVAIAGRSGSTAPEYRFRVVGTTDAAPINYTLGSTRTGSISTIGEQDAYTFTGTVGQKLYLDGRGGSNITARLYSPAGTEILNSPLTQDSSVFTLSQSGSYRLVIDGSGAATGNYTFRLSDVASATALTLGNERGGTLAAADATDLYRFNATAGQRIYVDSISSTGNWNDIYWTVYGPNGQSVTSNYLYPDGQGDGEFVAATTGVYTLVLAGRSGSTAPEYRFRVVGTTDAAPINYTLGSTRTGSISTIGEQDAYTFTGTAGQKLYLDGRGGSSITARLYSPAGTEILNRPLTQDSSVFTLPQSGSYRLVIDGDGAATGDYTFRLSDVASATVLTLGAERTGTLNPANATDLYRFHATAGQRINFDAITSTGNWYDIYWTIYGPHAQAHAANYIYSNGSGDGSFLAPVTGEYVVAVAGQSSATPVSYSFRITAETYSTTNSDFSEVRSGTIAPGQVDTYTFTGAAGTVVYFDSQDRDNQPIRLVLVAPDGTLLNIGIDADDYGPYQLPASGEYTLRVEGQNASSTGDYRFRLLNLAVDSTPLTLGQAVSGSLPNFQADFYRFSAVAGQRLLFDALHQDWSTQISYAIYAADGSTVLWNSHLTDSALFTLPFGGEFFLRVESTTSTQDYAFRLLDVAQAPSQAYTLGTAQVGTLAPGTSLNFHWFEGTAGQRIYIDLLSSSAGTTGSWRLYGPNDQYLHGSTIHANSDGEFVLGSTGRYVLAFSGTNTTADVLYSFRVLETTSETTALTLGATTTGTIAEVGDQHVYTFNGSVGQTLLLDSLSHSSNLRVHLYSPSGIQLNPSYSYLWYAEHPLITLTEAGEFRLVIDGDGATTGDYGFRLLDVAAAPTLTLGSEQTDTLSPGVSAEVYAFEGTAGQRIYVDLLSPTSGTTGSWRLYGPNDQYLFGSTINANNDGEFVLGSTGRYVLAFFGNNASADVSYSFRVLETTSETTALTLGATTTGTIAEVGDQHVYTFTGSVGQTLLLDSLSHASNLRVHLYSPSGIQLNPSYSYLWYAEHPLITLTEAGEYRLVIDGDGATTGDYGFRLLDVAAAPTLTLGSEQTGTLSPGVSADAYTFEGTAGQRIYVDLLSPTSGTTGTWRLYNTGGQQIAGSTISAHNDGEAVLNATGRYLLVFFGNNASADVSYSFRVSESTVSTQALTLGATTTGTIAEVGDQHVYTFNATAGQRIAVDLLANLNSPLFPVLYDPFGTVVYGSMNASDVNSLTLLYTGEYRLVIDGYGSATGNYGLRVIDLATVETPSIGTDKAVVTVLLTEPSAATAHVWYATTNGTATAGSDYVAQSNYLYFAPNVTSRVIVIPIVGDTTVEQDETFYINLSNPSSGQTISDSQSRVTILNDDTSATLAIDDVIRTEGSGGGTTDFTFTVTLSSALAQAVTVAYATADGTATAGSDYTAATGTLTFAPGETTKTITVKVIADGDGEGNETFFVVLSSPTNALIADGTGQGTILNDDAQASINDVVVVEGDSGTTNAVFTVTLSSPSSLPITINYATANGTATAGSDYTAASGSITFAPGETSKTISVAVLGDPNSEADETFFVNLSNAVNATFADSQGRALIRNDDGALSISDASIVEGDSGTRQIQFTVHLAHASTRSITVAYATADGTATAGSDYTAASGTLTFAPGETTKTISVNVLGDSEPEANEQFFVNLSNAGNAAIIDGQAIGTIYNDDTTIAILDASVDEGDSGTKTVQVTVRLSVASSNTVTVKYATADGTATAGSDYTAASGTLTFAPGETTKTISVTIRGDSVSEAHEWFRVDLSDPTSALLADAQAVVTIRNDDASLRVAGGSVTEGDSGTRTFDFVVSLLHPTIHPVTVAYATADGTATAGSDYTAASGTLTFAPGETTKTVSVTIQGDVLVEDDETFHLDLSAPTNATIATARGTAVIVNDDAVPSLSIASRTQVEGHSGTTQLELLVTLSTPSSKTVTVAYATADGTATAGSDYTAASGTLTFAPGETTKTIVVNVLGDLLDENDESFKVVLSSPTNATIAVAEGVGTILDDDAAPSLSINNVSAVEGDSGTSQFTFTVSLSAPSDKTVTVAYATANGTATAGSDYTAANGTLTFAPGETTKTIVVNVLGDLLDENDESFKVVLSSSTNATIAVAEGVGTILDDDAAPSLSINNVAAVEGDSGTSPFTFTVSLSAPSGKTVTVAYATANGTATAGSDYTAASSTLTFAPGETTKTIVVNVVGDELSEENESFRVVLSSSTNATIAVAEGIGTILDDDGAPSLLVGDVSVIEGDSGETEAVFTVTLTKASGQTVTVAYTTADGTATAGSDYTAASGMLTFAPGETTKTVTVRIKGDATVEPDESFALLLSESVNAGIGVGEATAWIRNDDAVVSISNASVVEGDSGVARLDFVVSIAHASALPITVDFTTVAGSATAGLDFTAVGGTLTFAPGETSKIVSVDVLGDQLDEDDETFTVKLSSPTNATIAVAEGVGTILDDDAAPSISIGDAVVVEGDAGTVDAVFTVSLSAVSGKTITVDYSTLGGTATADVDFESNAGVLIFAPGETSKTVTIRVKGDVEIEADETFTVELASPTNATIVDGTGVGLIQNDDVATDPRPTVVSFVVDDGTAQRSMVRSLTVTFSEEVTISDGAFELRAADGSLIPVQVEARVENGRTIAVLTFTGDGIVGGSLRDGNYRLTILADRVVDSAGGRLDGDDPNDAAIFDLYRLFGDLDGDRDVDSADYAKLYQTVRSLGAYLAALDADGDGDVDADDVAQFQARYRTRLQP